MVSHKNKRIATIGAGISGIIAANVLQKNGIECDRTPGKKTVFYLMPFSDRARTL